MGMQCAALTPLAPSLHAIDVRATAASKATGEPGAARPQALQAAEIGPAHWQLRQLAIS